MKTPIRWQKRNLQRDQTRRVILNTIKSGGPLSRLEIAERANIRPSTVTFFVDSLIRDGLVREMGPGASRGGRRPVLLEVNARARAAIGIHLSRERMLGVAIDLQGSTLSRVTGKPAFSSPDTLLDEILDLARRIMREAGVPARKVLGVGMGLPGLVDRKEGIARVCTGFPWWRDIPVRARIENVLGLPTFVENDTKVLTLAEKWFGHGRGIRDLLYVEMSDGIAAGLIINGELYYGAHGIAGELGHTVIDLSGDACECGRRGCVESSSLFRSLAANRARVPGRHPARRLIEEAAEHLGVAIVNVIHLINPQLVVIGGTLGVACRDILAPVIQRAISEQALDASSRATGLAWSDLGEDAGARGAATLALATLFDVA